MKRFLFVFGYESPVEHAANAKDRTDFESSSAVWVRANSEDEAIRKGCDYASQFVGRQYEQAGITDFQGWVEGNFAHWISHNPQDEFSGIALEALDEI